MNDESVSKNLEKLGLKNWHSRAKELRSMLEDYHKPKELLSPEKAKAFCEAFGGIVMITSRKMQTTTFMTEERMKTAIKFKCDVCGDLIYLLPEDHKQREAEGKVKYPVYCMKPSCELVIQGDDLPIVTEDGVLHNKGVSLTMEDFEE